MADTLYFTLTNVNFSFAEHIAQLMKVGQAGVKVMGLLSEAHTKALGLAPQILDAIKAGQLKQVFVVAGCDAPGKAGDYFRDVAEKLPKDVAILTSSCGKFRFNDIDFGMIEGTGIPRYLDLGQCNDSNGAVEIALALSQALDVPINDLPIKIVLSWMEQKAIIILLALFSLGVKNIKLGPKPPQFFNEEITNFLAEQFQLSYTTTADADLKDLLAV